MRACFFVGRSLPLLYRRCILVLLVWSISLSSVALPVAAQSSVPTSIDLQVLTPDFELDSQAVRVPGYGVDHSPGAPALPVWSTIVELPSSSSWHVTYQAPGARVLSQTVDIAAVPVPELASPGPHGWAVEEGLPSSVPTVNRPDAAIYGVDAFYPPSPVAPGQVQWQRGRRLLALRVFPFQYNPVTRRLRYHPDLQITVNLTPGESMERPLGHLQGGVNSVALTGSALRIRTGGRGLYRLTYDDLLTAGVPLASSDPTTFAMSYLGQPIGIEVTGDGDSTFEPGELVIFYAEPYQGRYQANNVYWFTFGGPAGARMASRSVTPTGTEPLVTTITQTLHVEFDREYRSDYPRPKDADHWFDTPLSPDIATGILTATRTYDLALDDVLVHGHLFVTAALHGGADRPANPDKSIAIRLNNHALGTYQWEGLTDYLATANAPASWLDGSPNRISLVAAISQLPGNEFYSVSPDWVDITYPALAEAEGDRIYVESVVGGANRIAIAGFSTPQTQVYDVRDPHQPVRLTTTQAVATGGTYTIHFWDAALPKPTYFLSSQAALTAPLAIEPDFPSSWSSPSHEADYIAVVHPSLWNAIQPLMDHRTAEGLRVAKVDVQDVYDEWSFGRRDPEAIRSFLTFAYQHWNGTGPRPQYVLLVGDGHYDFTGVSGSTLPNLIPPYLIDVDPWLGETAADNRFVSVDGPSDYLPDMAVGRIPATSAAEVTAVVNKIVAYETTAPSGDWQNRVVFVADNNSDSAGNFHAYSDEIRLNWLPTSYQSQTIYYYRDYFSAPAMRTAIKNAFNADAFYLQWFGHSGKFRWGLNLLFNIFDPPALTANDTWPVTAAYSCWAGYFINLTTNYQSLGETLLLSAQRGSVADFSPSGLHIGDALLVLDQGLASAMFQHRVPRIGDAVNSAKLYYFGHSGSFLDVIDTSILFGDPALKLRLPNPPLSVNQASLSAEADGDAVLVLWETVTEHQNVGFTLYRSQLPDQEGDLLAFVPSQTPGSGQGAVYEYSDIAVTPGQTYWYTLEAVDVHGATTRHGPVSVNFAAPTAVTFSGVHASSAAGPAIPLEGALLALLAPLAGALVVRRRRA